MKAVVDEGVPARLAVELRLRGLDIADFLPEWRGFQNGKLLAGLRDAGFECLLTCDRNLHHQQNLARWNVAIVVLPRSRFEDLVPFLDRIVAALDRCERGRAFVIVAGGMDDFV